jgi:hypothetical protein
MAFLFQWGFLWSYAERVVPMSPVFVRYFALLMALVFVYSGATFGVFNGFRGVHLCPYSGARSGISASLLV